jgi:hypothetical protein
VAYRGRCQADQIRGFVKTAGFRDCLKNLITEKRHTSPPFFCSSLSGAAVLEIFPSLVHFLLEEFDQMLVSGFKEMLESPLGL